MDHAPAPPDKKPRKPRLHLATVTARQRAKATPLAAIQQGVETLWLLDQFGGLTSSQVSRSLFYRQRTERRPPRNLDAADRATNQMCLRPLKDSGLVQVVGYRKYHFDANIDEHRFGQLEINHLTLAGSRALQQHYADRGEAYTPHYYGELRHDLLRATPHTLEIINGVVTLLAHAKLDGYAFDGWLIDSEIKALNLKGKTLLHGLEPDAIFVLRKEKLRVPFFVEIDRGTEPPYGEAANTWETKMHKYAAYLQGRYKDDTAFPYAPQPFVLMITTNEDRLQHLRTATARTSGRNGYLFITRLFLDPHINPATGRRDVPDLFGPHWRVPHDDTPHALRDDLGKLLLRFQA